jgi:hypothetical protein
MSASKFNSRTRLAVLEDLPTACNDCPLLLSFFRRMLRYNVGAVSLRRVRQQELKLATFRLVLGAKYAAGNLYEVAGVSRYSIMSSSSSAERSSRDGILWISGVGRGVRGSRFLLSLGSLFVRAIDVGFGVCFSCLAQLSVSR